MGQVHGGMWGGTVRRRVGVWLMAVVALAACEARGEPSEGGPSTRPPSVPSDASSRRVVRFVEHTWPTGASGTVMAARDGRIVACLGIGPADPETGTPAGCDTVYDVMSMTKQFTAAAILKLEMMGELELADPISVWFDDVPKDKRGITIEQLLTHTSGLRESLGGDYEPLSREQMIEGALESDLLAPPGSDYRYSNLGYSLLAAIVEIVSGTGYEQFLAEHLFVPAGMAHTGYVIPEWDEVQLATEFDRQGRPRGTPLDHPWDEDGPYWNLRGNGGLLSTARDVFRWHVALEGEEVLDQRAKELMFTPYVREEVGGSSYAGYGWAVVPVSDFGKLAWHDGGNGWSFGLLARFLDEGVVVFWISNHAYQAGEWNLAHIGQELTLGIAERAMGRR